MMKTLFGIIVVLSFEVQISLSVVSVWGEACNYTAECSDHRMVCARDTFNESKCECDRFHEWQGAETGCVLTYDLETILNMTVTSSDNKGMLEKYQQHIYFGHKVAGFFIMGVAMICPMVVAVHCFHMKRKDRILQSELKVIKERVENAKKARHYQRAPELIV